MNPLFNAHEIFIYDGRNVFIVSNDEESTTGRILIGDVHDTSGDWCRIVTRGELEMPTEDDLSWV